MAAAIFSTENCIDIKSTIALMSERARIRTTQTSWLHTETDATASKASLSVRGGRTVNDVNETEIGKTERESRGREKYTCSQTGFRPLLGVRKRRNKLHPRRNG